MPFQHQKSLILAAALAAAAGPGAGAGAQPQYFFIETSNSISPDQPTAELDVWATFDPDFYAFAGTSFQIGSAPGEGAFYNPRLPKKFVGKAGAVSPDGDAVTGIESGQYQYPPNLLADTHNPIRVWSCSWTSSDFTPRRVVVSLEADQFLVYFDVFGNGGPVPFIPDALGYIQVVPDPGVAGVLALGALPAARRRRRE
jgi:hypothetical protein